MSSSDLHNIQKKRKDIKEAEKEEKYDEDSGKKKDGSDPINDMCHLQRAELNWGNAEHLKKVVSTAILS